MTPLAIYKKEKSIILYDLMTNEMSSLIISVNLYMDE
jgi:hypothetical protein